MRTLRAIFIAHFRQKVKKMNQKKVRKKYISVTASPEGKIGCFSMHLSTQADFLWASVVLLSFAGKDSSRRQVQTSIQPQQTLFDIRHDAAWGNPAINRITIWPEGSPIARNGNQLLPQSRRSGVLPLSRQDERLEDQKQVEGQYTMPK